MIKQVRAGNKMLTDRHTDGRTDGHTDGYMDGRTDPFIEMRGRETKKERGAGIGTKIRHMWCVCEQ